MSVVSLRDQDRTRRFRHNPVGFVHKVKSPGILPMDAEHDQVATLLDGDTLDLGHCIFAELDAEFRGKFELRPVSQDLAQA